MRIPVNREQASIVQKGGRWLRVATLTLTMVGPIVNMLLERLRQRSQLLKEQSEEMQDRARSAQATALDHLDDVTAATRKSVLEQTKQLQKQAQQLQKQAHDLRKALRNEAKQRRRLNKMLKQLRKAGIDWSQELRKRGEDLAEDLVLQGGRISQDLLERGSKVTQDLTERSGQVSLDLVKRSRKLSQNLVERGGKVTQDLTERGGQLSQVLARRGSDFGQDLAERSEQLLQPARERKRIFWSIFGFSFGLVAATIVTYFFIRNRMVQQEIEQNQHIELPQDQALNTTGISRPAGEIRRLDSDGAAVATLQSVSVDAEKSAEAPADAAFVGVVSTQCYYPVNTSLDAIDLIYFSTEEEAKEQGYTAAE